jgi:hypothetical protein
LAGNLLIEFEGLFESGSLLLHLAGSLLVRPESGLGDNFLEIVELALFAGAVKGTSALPGFGFLPG